MDKPILVARQEFAQALFQTIGQSGLPMFMVEYVLQDVTREIHRLVTEETQRQEKAYKEEHGKEVKDDGEHRNENNHC